MPETQKQKRRVGQRERGALQLRQPIHTDSVGDWHRYGPAWLRRRNAGRLHPRFRARAGRRSSVSCRLPNLETEGRDGERA
jgi:hypothetical protein